VRHLALCGVCGAQRATVRPWNQFLPLTRPLSSTGEWEACSVHPQGGYASAWPPFEVILGYTDRVEKRNTEIMGRIKRKHSAQRGRPAVPDQWTGRPGGSGAQPPLHLIHMVKVGLNRGYGSNARLHAHGPRFDCEESRLYLNRRRPSEKASKLVCKNAIVHLQNQITRLCRALQMKMLVDGANNG